MKLKVIISHFFISLFISFVLIIFPFFLHNERDFIIGYSVPKYPNSTYWKFDSNLNLLNKPYAEIQFQTEDVPETVMTYYKNKLEGLGWKSVTSEVSTTSYFTKKIGSTYYEIYIIFWNNIYTGNLRGRYIEDTKLYNWTITVRNADLYAK